MSRILIKDNLHGIIHEYGSDQHDGLKISDDGTCLYYENLQNGDGSKSGNYTFVMEDGNVPKNSKLPDAEYGMSYVNIGGFH